MFAIASYCTVAILYVTDRSFKPNDHWWHVLEPFNKTTVNTEPAIECVRIFKSIILAFVFVDIAKSL